MVAPRVATALRADEPPEEDDHQSCGDHRSRDAHEIEAGEISAAEAERRRIDGKDTGSNTEDSGEDVEEEERKEKGRLRGGLQARSGSISRIKAAIA